VQALENSGVLLRIRNELERMEQAQRQRRKRAKKRQQPERFVFSEEDRKANVQQQLLARVQKIGQEAASLEELTLLEFYAKKPVDAAFVSAAREDLFQQLQALLFDLYRDTREGDARLVIALYGQSMKLVGRLAEAYEAICEQESGLWSKYWIKMYREELDAEYRAAHGLDPLPRSVEVPAVDLCRAKTSPNEPPEKVASLFGMKVGEDAPPDDCIGVVLHVLKNPRTIALLETESGKHHFVRDGVRHGTVHVETLATDRAAKYEPPADVGRFGAFQSQRERRTYDATGEVCRDTLLNRDFALPRDQLPAAIDEAARTYLLQRVWDLIDTWN
jgi:hypothetical protein